LLYYPGKPEGYLLLAQARLGEGNINLALDALDRVIEARASLPELEQPQVLQAYRQRAQLLTGLGRYEEALDDIGALLQTNPDNLSLIEQQGDLAYRLGRYNLALESLGIVLADNAQAVAAATDEAPVAPRLDLELRRLEIITELCEFSEELDCDYGTAAGQLTDDFIRQLDSAAALQAQAYRAKATYHLTLADSRLSNNERQRAFTRALTDIEAVLAVQQTGLNQYYRGLILEALENPGGAILAYTWVNYWAQFYAYPFAEDAQARLEALQPESSS
jgi:tetratricopeptide (TPR) repeat protein